jgi:hypothetical protein
MCVPSGGRTVPDERTPEQLPVEKRRRAGHYEILGETYAKFEFFEKGWNPYSRFLDVDEVDFILRKRIGGDIVYREVQVKFGKLHPVGSAWEKRIFDFSSWAFFHKDEFADQVDQKDFFIAYVLSRDPDPLKPSYQGDIFIFPVQKFAEIIRLGVGGGNERKVYLSRKKGEEEHWFLRKSGRRFETITDEVCLDVTKYRRNFGALFP